MIRGKCSSAPGSSPIIFPRLLPTSRPGAPALFNAVPPDLSVIAKARGYERGFPLWLLDMLTQYQEHGVDYITALLQGYGGKPPAGVTVPPGSFYNKYYPAHTIAMPPPLSDKRVDYTDGSPMTGEQDTQGIP